MKAKDFFSKLDTALVTVIKWLCVFLFVLLTLIITANVFVRYVPIMSLHWLDEIVELAFAWMVFFGSAAVWILKGHFSAGDWIGKRLKNSRAKAAYRLVVDLVASVFIGVFFWYSLQLVMRSMEVTAVFGFPRKIIYAAMPISSGIMFLYSLRFIVEGAMLVAARKKYTGI
ncbi:MAG TPA: TRAP transporter small permease [Rectinemataceae bacterium]